MPVANAMVIAPIFFPSFSKNFAKGAKIINPASDGGHTDSALPAAVIIAGDFFLPTVCIIVSAIEIVAPVFSIIVTIAIQTIINMP